MVRITRSRSVPRGIRATHNAITALTDTFCRDHLNDEYLELGLDMTAALCWRRPSPAWRWLMSAPGLMVAEVPPRVRCRSSHGRSMPTGRSEAVAGEPLRAKPAGVGAMSTDCWLISATCRENSRISPLRRA
ncbi:DUF6398 domain-containing protein [Microvirga makkahensis]|uniref:DUF6398 domain-containing protein n=1 Tax=Microvirga makkahensis TaxID=1128670 RepID=UPI003CCCE1B3